jgi:uncharacterized protein (TIGR02466 family)
MAFDEPEVRLLFPVPLVTIRLNGHDALNERLLTEIAARREAEPGMDRSNRDGWHSALDFFERPEPAHAELAAEIAAATSAATAKLAPDLSARLAARHEGWVNVSPTHAMNIPHDHSNAFWSGTYYVQVPGDEADPQSGALEFLDPRGTLGAASRLETPFTRGKVTLRPAAGTCLVWPGFVRHWVYPNQSAEERVSVAFNSWFVPFSA